MKLVASLCRRLRYAWWQLKLRTWVRFAERHALFVDVSPDYVRRFRNLDIWSEMRRFLDDHRLFEKWRNTHQKS